MPSRANQKIRVLVAGVGGASLGTEIIKCLALAGRYQIFGCDISPYAFGLYEPTLQDAFLADRDNYVQSVLEVSRKSHVQVIVPGGEQPLALLGAAREVFRKNGILIAANSQALTERFADKSETFRVLKSLDIAVPATLAIRSPSQIRDIPYPCIIKPARGSGGSFSVFLAASPAEAAHYISHVAASGGEAVVQEYIADSEGEFTVGVLHLPDDRLAGSIALRRLLDPKLSYVFKSATGVISSGYSQGLIAEFPEVRITAERIANAVGSKGPLNIQGRVRKGTLLPFEINARFSASTYLRALAGFNEVDIFLQHLVLGRRAANHQVRSGYYLRTLNERFVPLSAIKS